MVHEKICFWIAKFMSNKYLVKSLQRYAKAQKFYEVVKIGQWLIQHWFHNKVIFMTPGNDSLQICQLGCAVSNNYHCEYSSTSHPMCCEFSWIRNEKCKSNTYLLANFSKLQLKYLALKLFLMKEVPLAADSQNQNE